MRALPAGVGSIKLDYKIIDRNEYWMEHLWFNVAQLTVKQGIERLAFDTIRLPIEIDGKLLNGCIRELEKLNDPIANLTCGLLLEGQIETTTDILENCNEYDEHREKRNHDAISFYTKAANDATLKPMVEFLLRNMKTTCSSASIQNRLAPYDLVHQDNFNCELNQASKARLGVAIPLLASLGKFAPPSKSESEVGFNTRLEFSSSL